MTSPRLRIHFDFIDPLCWLLGQELSSVVGIPTDSIEWSPFELRPPPLPVTTLDDPDLGPRWRDAERYGAERSVRFAPPALVPWTRKAHELVAHAAEAGQGPAVRVMIHESYLLEGLDIGRVDILVDIARKAGLDASEAKAVLDVDRHTGRIGEIRAQAESAGVRTSPTLVLGTRRLEGFHIGDALRTFLGT